MHRSHGTGEFLPDQFRSLGANVIFERGVLVFHPENMILGNDIYIGHNTILKGYYHNVMQIGNGTWIGQMCFFHSAGGLMIGENVGIGPFVKIITSEHELKSDLPVLHSPIRFAKVTIESDSDIGVSAIILPGITIGKGAVVGAGSVVTKDVPAFAVVAGSPARLIRFLK